MTHLGGCCDSSISSQVETPLSKPHHGLITPVFGLCNVLVYLLQPRVTVEWEEQPHQRAKRKITGKEKQEHFNLDMQTSLRFWDNDLKKVTFLPSLCWTGSGGQICGREHWSPWCMGTGARSQKQSSAQSKMETWEIKQSYIIRKEKN